LLVTSFDDSPERAAYRLAAIVESSDDAIVSKDLNGTITSWNKAAERVFGYAAEEMIGQSIRRIIPRDRQSEEDEVLARIRRGERVDHFETIRLRKDGTLVPISLTVSPLRNRDGRVIGASKIARDISERVRLQAEARGQAANTRVLGEIGVSLASSLDRENIVQKITAAATELTSAECGAFFYRLTDAQSGEPETLVGVANETFTTFARRRASTLFEHTFRGAAAIRLDDVTKDPRYGKDAPTDEELCGTQAVRSYLAVPVRAASGETLGGMFFTHSKVGAFTEQHEQLVTSIAALASVALVNAHLYVEARDANRMKDEFLAVLSHELRTPLNAIVGYARLLRDGVLTGDKAEQGFETLERNATVLAQMVEDVLDVSRIVAGKIRLEMQSVKLPLVVHNAIATVQPAADAKGVRLETIVQPNISLVSGDPDRLQQVVWNLLSNAVKFTPRDGCVQVRMEDHDSHIDIIVTDTGTGIRAEFLPYVFERFRQADSGATRTTGGLGLGLAIVRHIVEMHGGTVHAASDGEGRGSTFRVRLPVKRIRAESVEGRRELAPAARLQRTAGLDDLQGIRVLAVDDEADALTLLRVILESAGAEVITVSSPHAAVERIAAVRPHALVIDLGMPGMSGFELITRIRASSDSAVRDIPAAALTAFARSEDRTKALRSGFEIHLAKPVDPGELVASVSTLVRRARGIPQTR
jgi:PAS domain S-box-containing protein